MAHLHRPLLPLFMGLATASALAACLDAAENPRRPARAVGASNADASALDGGADAQEATPRDADASAPDAQFADDAAKDAAADAARLDGADAPSDATTLDAAADATPDVDPGPPAQIVASAVSGTTSELGRTATFTLRLTRRPTADVTVTTGTSLPSEGSLSTPSVTFTPANWATPQTLIVTGVADDVDDGDQAFQIRIGAAVSADPAYAGLTTPAVTVTNVGAIDVLRNGGFEIGAGVDFDFPATFPANWALEGGWEGSPNAPFNAQIVPAAAHTGLLGLRLYRAAQTDGTHLPSVQQRFPVPAALAGRPFRFRGLARAASSTSAVRFLLAADTASDAHLTLEYADSGNGGGWDGVSVTANVPVGTDHVTVIVGSPTANYFGDAYTDSLRLEYAP